MGGWVVALAAAGLWAGIAWAGFQHPPPSLGRGVVFLGVGGLSIGLLAVVASLPARRAESLVPAGAAFFRAGTAVALAAVTVAFALLGAGWGSLRAARARASPLLDLVGRPVEVSGSLLQEPSSEARGWSAPLQAHAVAEAADDDGSRGLRVNDTVWLEGERAPPGARTGVRIAVHGWLHAPRGEFGEFLLRRGYVGTLEAERVEVTGPPRNPFRRLANSVRAALARSLEQVLPAREAGLLMGLALGDTSRLDPIVEEDFRATGLSHLTAVSGQNVAMFLAPVLGVAIASGAKRFGRLAIGLGATGFFVLLTGAEPSVLRAAAMASLTLLGLFLGRPRSPPAIVGGAVLVVLGTNPTLVHAIGFQLSVAATAGIALLAGPLSARLERVPRWLALPLAATLGAQAGVFPLLLYHFGVVPTVALPANLLAVAAVAPAMLLGLLAGCLGMILPPVGRAVALAAYLPLRYLEGVAHELARSPLPSITSGGGQLIALFAGLLAVGLTAWWLRSGRKVVRPLVLAIVATLPAFLVAGALRAGPPGTLTVTFFDVGQGDSALVRSSRGATILIDGGPDEDEVARKLAALGIKRLDVLVVSHYHADHLGGLPRVLARFHVALVMDSGCDADSPFYEAYRRAVDAAGVPVRHPRAGAALHVGELRVEVIGPSECHAATESDVNNDSLVLRISEGPWSVLFTGDAEEPAQSELLEDHAASLVSTVLKVPHQGGATSLEEFFAAVDARVAIVSVGPNTYGHPVPDVLDDLAREGMRVLRTDRLGDITVSFEHGEVLIESSRG